MQRFLVFLLILIIPSFLSAQQHQKRFSEIDIQHYQFNLNLSDESDQIKGIANIHLKFKKSVTSFYLDLYHTRRDGKGMLANKVTLNGEAIKFAHQGDQLVIWLENPANINKLYLISVEYDGTPADGLVIGINKYGDRTFFGDNWPNRAHHWLPTVDHPSDKASVEFIVDAPDKYQVIGSGTQLEETDLPNNRKLTHWSSKVNLPTKVMVIGAAEFAVQLAGHVHGIPVSSWVYPQNRMEGFYDYEQAVKVLDWFHDHVAPYPYTKLANVQSKTRYGGMENASNIFYFENSVTGKRERESLIAHEVAHQWFGDSASEADWHHVWLSEGLATYFTHLYFEHQYGGQALADRLQSDRTKIVDYAQKNPNSPIVDTTITDYNKVLSTNTYQKASWVLHMLRQKIGTETFWEGIRAYYEAYQYNNALTHDFQHIMERISGQDLSVFFQQWFMQPGLPELKVEWSYDTTKKQVIIAVKQDGSPFVFPLEVAVLNNQGQEIGKSTAAINAMATQWAIDVEEVPKELSLDPDTKILFNAKISKK